MKKISILSLLLISLLCSVSVKAQYCGGSGSNVCSTANSPLTAEGFFPAENNLPCIIDGHYYDTVIQIRTPSQVSSGSSSYTLDYITITSITNLPCGLCWQLGDPNNQIQGNADGCLRVYGTSYDAPGEYLLDIVVNATVYFIGSATVTEDNQNLSSQGLRFFVRVALPNGPCAAVDTNSNGNTAITTVGNVSVPSISGPASVCTGGSATLTASGGSYYGYVWSTGANTPSINVSSSGTYTVTVFENCASATASKTLTVTPPPTVSITPPSATACAGASTTLTATGGGTYAWSNSAASAAITVTPNTTTTYTVTITNSSNCSATSSAIVTVNPSASVSISPVTDTICGNTPTTLTATGSGTYAWSNGATTAAVTVSPSNTTSYVVTITNSSSCTATATARVVTKSAGSTISATGPTTFCTGGSVTLQLDTTAGTYVWSTGATTASITVNQSGSYNATVTVNGCTAPTNAIAVTVGSNLTPTIVANPSLNICPGGSAILDAGSGYTTYTWSGGAGTHETAVITTAGTYTVTVTSGTCSGSASATVNVSNFPLSVTVSPAGPVTTCQGDTLSLKAQSGFASYAWSTGSQTAGAQATTSGDYSVTVTKNACVGVDTVRITFNATPMPVISSVGSTSSCTGDTVTLDAGTGFSSYNWSDGETTETIQPVTAGSFDVTVTLAGCAGTATPVNVTFAVSPTPIITPTGGVTIMGNINICSGSAVLLDAGAGYSSYTWSNGATTQTVSATTAGAYTVSVTKNGCPGVAASNVSVIAKPVATISATNNTGSAYLTANPAGATYQWLLQTSPNGSYNVTANTSQFDTVTCGNSAAYYSVIATQSGCADTSSQQEVICTGINEISSLVSFNIEPNPATDVLFVNYELNESTGIKLSIIDLTGRVVMDVVNTSEGKGNHQHQVKLSDIASGVYLLNFVTDNGSFNAKFVKQ